MKSNDTQMPSAAKPMKSEPWFNNETTTVLNAISSVITSAAQFLSAPSPHVLLRPVYQSKLELGLRIRHVLFPLFRSRLRRRPGCLIQVDRRLIGPLARLRIPLPRLQAGILRPQAHRLCQATLCLHSKLGLGHNGIWGQRKGF